MTKPNTETPALFDLGQITAANTGTLDIVHPVTGQPTGWKLTIAGPEHPVTEAVTKEVERENDERARAIEQARVNGKKWKAPGDGEETRQKFAERVSRRILGWTPVTFDGATFDYSPANATRLLREGKFEPVAKQIFDYMGDEASFTKRSAKS